MAIRNTLNYRGRGKNINPVPPPPPPHQNLPSQAHQRVPYKPRRVIGKKPFHKTHKVAEKPSYNPNVLSKEELEKIIQHSIANSNSSNIFELELQAKLLADLMSFDPIIDVTQEDSLNIDFNHTKLDSIMLTIRTTGPDSIRETESETHSEEREPKFPAGGAPTSSYEDKDRNIGMAFRPVSKDGTEGSPVPITQGPLLMSRHSISSTDSTDHDFNNYTYWLIKSKQKDLTSIENMIKAPGFNFLNVPRKLLSTAAQVISRAFFDPSYCSYLDQSDESVY